MVSKKSKFIYGLLGLTIALTSTSAIYASNVNEKEVKTEVEKKVDIMLNNSYSNLKELFEIDDKDYVKLSYADLEKLNSSKIKEFKDKEFCSKASQLIHSANKEMPIGYTLPLIYIKKDMSEILICSQNESGESKMITLNCETTSNNLKRSNSDDLSLNDKNKKIIYKQGKPILKVDDIKLNN